MGKQEREKKIEKKTKKRKKRIDKDDKRIRVVRWLKLVAVADGTAARLESTDDDGWLLRTTLQDVNQRYFEESKNGTIEKNRLFCIV